MGLKEFYSEMNFNSLIRELDTLIPSAKAQASDETPEEQEEYILVDDEAGFSELIHYSVEAKRDLLRYRNDPHPSPSGGAGGNWICSRA